MNERVEGFSNRFVVVVVLCVVCNVKCMKSFINSHQYINWLAVISILFRLGKIVALFFIDCHQFSLNS